MTIKIGSLFSGIGGFELGLERAIPGAQTIWQVEQNLYCQSILKKHWPKAKIYDDVRNITKNNVEPIDLLCGGFPCQDISIAGNQKGINDGKKSSLWWEMLRIIGELEPRIVVLENVPAIISNGGLDVVGSLTSIGYDCEWTIISAKQFGAPHLRKRWFCVAYPCRIGRSTGSDLKRKDQDCLDKKRNTEKTDKQRCERIGGIGKTPFVITHPDRKTSYTNMSHGKTRTAHALCLEKSRKNRIWLRPWSHSLQTGGDTPSASNWREISGQSPVCRMDDGISDRLDSNRIRKQRLIALGNAIVPACSQYIGECILRSGLI